MDKVFGIDVAKWQGVIDWTKVAKTKQFAILKVTQKNNKIEDKFNINYKNASACGLSLGAYRYVYAKNEEQARKEAEAIVSACIGKKLPYGIWLDMEDASIRCIGKDMLTKIINIEAAVLNTAGLPVGIYCNKDWYDNILDGKALSRTYPFWIARYPAHDSGYYDANSTLNPSKYASAWQYSSRGTVNGILGNVDLDVAFTRIPRLFIAYCTLKQGDRGMQVCNLQRNLNRVINANLEVDGKFGPNTLQMLKQWQGATGLLKDGIYGPNSAAAMRNILE